MAGKDFQSFNGDGGLSAGLSSVEMGQTMIRLSSGYENIDAEEVREFGHR
jgi:hypothetical protein